MDYTNERYVRLYTRDTTTWKRLGWDGQCILMQLLRKADRSGVIDLGAGVEPWEAAVIHCGAPEATSRHGTARLMELGVIIHDGERLAFPRFLEAQESAQSDAQRKRESRARRAALVTNRDSARLSEATASRIVTESHDGSHAVTIGHSVPSLAVLNQTERETRARAREEHVPDQIPDTPPPPPTPADLDEVPMLRWSKPTNWARNPLEEKVANRFKARFAAATQSFPRAAAVSKMTASLVQWLEEHAPLRKTTPEALLEQLLEGYFSNPRAHSQGYPPSFLATNPVEYLIARGKGGAPIAPAQTGRLTELKHELAKCRGERGGADAARRYELDVREAELSMRISRLEAMS